MAELLRAAAEDQPRQDGLVFTYEVRKGWGARRREGERRPWTGDRLQRRWDEARQKISSKMRWHDATRASFATRLHEAGVDLVDIQQAMGHADIATTVRYINVKAKRTHAIILDAARRRQAQISHKKPGATLKVVK